MTQRFPKERVITEHDTVPAVVISIKDAGDDTIMKLVESMVADLKTVLFLKRFPPTPLSCRQHFLIGTIVLLRSTLVLLQTEWLKVSGLLNLRLEWKLITVIWTPRCFMERELNIFVIKFCVLEAQIR